MSLYQEVLGFGGAFTEASALVFQGLAPELQRELLDCAWWSRGSCGDRFFQFAKEPTKLRSIMKYHKVTCSLRLSEWMSSGMGSGVLCRSPST